MSEHSIHHPENTTDQAPRFVTAKRLDGANDPSACLYEIEDQPQETLPTLSQEQFKLMGKLKPEEITAENLDNLGLPVGEGVVAVSVDGEKRFINIGLEDYGTVTSPDKVQTLGAEKNEALDKLTRTVTTELENSAGLLERTVKDFANTDGDKTYLFQARDAALTLLDQASRRAIGGESVAITEELYSALSTLRQATDRLTLDVHGDTLNDRAAFVRRSSITVDNASADYFKDTDSAEEEERAAVIGRARSLQVEASSLLHEDVTHYVDGIDRDEKRIEELVTFMMDKFTHIDAITPESMQIYQDIQELIQLNVASSESSLKLRNSLVALEEHASDLRSFTDRLANP